MQWHAFVLLVYFTLSPLFNLRSLLHLPDPEPSVAEYQITKVQPTLVVRVEISCSSGRMGEHNQTQTGLWKAVKPLSGTRRQKPRNSLQIQ